MSKSNYACMAATALVEVEWPSVTLTSLMSNILEAGLGRGRIIRNTD